MAKYPTGTAFAYCHGFLSGPTSSKGRFLGSFLASRGASELSLLALNGPTGEPAALSHSGALQAIDDHWQATQHQTPGARLCLIGSSFGGWAAAAYASRHPSRVSRLLLLCPGFELAHRWEAIVGGSEALAQWERDGERSFLMPHTRAPVSIPWRLAADSMSLAPEVAAPLVRCPTTIVHGLHDDVVPLEVSRRFAARSKPFARLVAVDDDHWLCQPATLQRIADVAAELFELPPGSTDRTALWSP